MEIRIKSLKQNVLKVCAKVKKHAEALELAKKIEQVPCTIPVKVGEEEKIYRIRNCPGNR